MTELCTVKKLKRGRCYIELTRNEKCEGCKICSFNKKNTMVVPAVCEIGVKAGDMVVVEMPTVAVGAGSLLIYALPILFILVGALIGLLGGIWLQVGLCAAGLAVGLLAAWLIDRAYRRRPGVLPRVTGIADGAADKQQEKDSQGE